jgi:hypothetical protein
MAITREELVGAFTPACYRFQREGERNQREERDDRWGPPVSEGREGRGYRFGEGASWAAGLIWSWARWFPRGPFSIFIFLSLFPFLFSISFVSFAKRLQINSNHFQKFSKIQNNQPEQ